MTRDNGNITFNDMEWLNCDQHHHGLVTAIQDDWITWVQPGERPWSDDGPERVDGVHFGYFLRAVDSRFAARERSRGVS